MYHLKVQELADRRMSELVPTEDNDFMEVFREPLDKECVEFSVGNPRVEHITGIVHLYKRNSHVYGSREPWKAAPEISEVRLALSDPPPKSGALQHACMQNTAAPLDQAQWQGCCLVASQPARAPGLIHLECSRAALNLHTAWRPQLATHTP